MKSYGIPSLARGISGLALLISTCSAQQLTDDVNFKTMQLGGLHLYGVSLFSGYSTSAYPSSQVGGQIAQGASELGGDVNYGATAAAGWQFHGNRTSASVLYSGTYTGMARYSNLNALNHSLSIGAGRKFGQKWTLSFSGQGQDTTLQQFLYQPSSQSVLSQAASIDDMAAAYKLGQFSNSQVAAMLTGSPVLDTPGSSLLFGYRILSYSAQATMTYTHSSRLSFHFGSMTLSAQNWGSADKNQPSSSFAQSRTLGANGGVGLSYALSPRTQIGFDVEELRQTNRYQGGWTTTASASLGRRMGVHWFVNLSAGGSFLDATRQVYGSAQSRTMIGGASLGYKTLRHSFVGSYDRTTSAAFGAALGTSSRAGGSWGFHQPGAAWSLGSSFTWQQFGNTGFGNFTGWQASTGFSETLNSHMTLSVQYVYLNSNGIYLGRGSDLAIHSVRLSLGWNPQAAPQR